MRDEVKEKFVFSRLALFFCLALALLATGISLSILVIAGWQLGESMKEKILLAAFGALAVGGAHLLLTLCRPASLKIKLASMVLWLFCMVYVMINHANFLLSSHQQAGMHRIALFDQPSARLVRERNLIEILSDQEKIKTELDAKSRIRCERGCDSLKVKLNTLKAKLEVLYAEAGEFKRLRLLQDRQNDLKEALRDDPVTMPLATLSGVTAIQIGLMRSFLFAVILEGAACICWYIFLQSRDSSVTSAVTSVVTRIVTPTVTADSDVTKVLNVEVTQPITPLECQVEMLVKDVKAGRVDATVRALQKYCRCSQKQASALRKLVLIELENKSQLC
ncbi:hypothetical protein [Undibacterium sp. Ji22W]|uniref:hypothetical protein n=1 Tax=Undibacterium sp. Ji22W TaxID=3413038 RepID=UPI003BF26AA4